MNSSTPLEKAILRTLCWFSLFEYPLTSFEVYKWLWQKPEKQLGKTNPSYTLQDVFDCLQTSHYLKDRLEIQDGFFCVKKFGSLSWQIKKRQSGFVDASRKLKKLGKIFWWFRLFPSIQLVAACNSLGWFLTKPESDIDLFIVVKPGTVWFTRLFLVAPFLFFQKRPGNQRRIDPFCFSFFLTSEDLNLKRFLLKDQDPYFAYWVLSLVPILQTEEGFSILYEKNIWTKQEWPYAYPRPVHKELTYISSKHPWKFSPFEFFWKKLQWCRFPKTIRTLANQDTRIIVSDSVLKFHENDRRSFFSQASFSRFQQVL